MPLTKAVIQTAEALGKSEDELVTMIKEAYQNLLLAGKTDQLLVLIDTTGLNIDSDSAMMRSRYRKIAEDPDHYCGAKVRKALNQLADMDANEQAVFAQRMYEKFYSRGWGSQFLCLRESTLIPVDPDFVQDMYKEYARQGDFREMYSLFHLTGGIRPKPDPDLRASLIMRLCKTEEMSSDAFPDGPHPFGNIKINDVLILNPDTRLANLEVLEHINGRSFNGFEELALSKYILMQYHYLNRLASNKNFNFHWNSIDKAFLPCEEVAQKYYDYFIRRGMYHDIKYLLKATGIMPVASPEALAAMDEYKRCTKHNKFMTRATLFPESIDNTKLQGYYHQLIKASHTCSLIDLFDITRIPAAVPLGFEENVEKMMMEQREYQNTYPKSRTYAHLQEAFGLTEKEKQEESIADAKSNDEEPHHQTQNDYKELVAKGRYYRFRHTKTQTGIEPSDEVKVAIINSAVLP